MSMRGTVSIALVFLAYAGSVHAQSVSRGSRQFSWGTGSNEFGRLEPNESDAEGPASFVVDASGDLLVLDQVQSRIVRLDGHGLFVEAIPLPGSSYMEMEQLPDGRLVLLDRLVTRSVVIVDELLGVLGEYPVEGELVHESGAVTAMFVRGDGLWLEVSHTYSVRVLGVNWKPCVRSAVPGRPASSGPGTLVARLTGPESLHIAMVDGTGRANWSRELQYDDPIERIVWVEDLPDGRTLVVAHTRSETTSKEQLRATRLTPFGEVEAAGEVPYVVATWYLQRDVRLLPGGNLLRMWYDESGVHLDEWRLP